MIQLIIALIGFWWAKRQGFRKSLKFLVNFILIIMIKFTSSGRYLKIFVAFLDNLNFKEIIGRNKLGSNLLKKVVQKIKTLKFSHVCQLFIPQFKKVLYKVSLIMFLFLAARCTTSKKVRFCEHDSHSVIPTSTTNWWVSSTPFDFLFLSNRY